MANVAEVRGVSRFYGETRALDALSLGIEDGALTAVLGPSGCGKTTLLRILAGLEDPDEGEVILKGMVAASPESRIPPEGRGVALVFQDLALWPHMTVRGNISFPLEARERDGARREAEAERAAALVSIAHRLDAYPATLSGGERQRVALARALAGRPGILLLDEPFSGLDAVLRFRLLEAVAEVRARLGIAAVLVTHDQDEALGAADRVVVLRKGRVAQEGTALEIYGSPRSRFVASFVGLASFLEGEDLGGGKARTAVGEVPFRGRTAAGNGRLFLSVRPEDLRVDGEGGVRATVLRSMYRGAGWILSVEAAGTRLLVRSEEAAEAGAEVGLRFAAPALAVEEDGTERDGGGEEGA